MEPTSGEKESQEACQLIVWLCLRLSLKPPAYAISGAKSIYGSRLHALNYLVKRLCSLCDKAGDEIIYADARDPEMRRVATWWEAHQEQDRLKAERVKNAESQRIRDRAVDLIKLLEDWQVEDLIIYARALRNAKPKKPTSDKATDAAG